MIDKDFLVADLRNKLSPVFGYFETKRLLDLTIASNDDTFLNGVRQVELEEQLKKQLILAEASVHKVLHIIELLEKL
jgi:hypothetical protein